MPVTSLERIGYTPGKSEPVEPELVKPVLSKSAPPSCAPAPKIGLPLEPDAPNAPPQRGSISGGRSDQLKLQLWLADKLRQSIAPEVPLEVPLERTEEREQIIQYRYQQAKQRANIQIPAGVAEETFYSNVLDKAINVHS